MSASSVLLPAIASSSPMSFPSRIRLAPGFPPPPVPGWTCKAGPCGVGAGEVPAPTPRDPAGVRAARRALSCGDVHLLQEATSAPMTRGASYATSSSHRDSPGFASRPIPFRLKRHSVTGPTRGPRCRHRRPRRDELVVRYPQTRRAEVLPAFTAAISPRYRLASILRGAIDRLGRHGRRARGACSAWDSAACRRHKMALLQTSRTRPASARLLVPTGRSGHHRRRLPGAGQVLPGRAQDAHDPRDPHPAADALVAHCELIGTRTLV